MNSKKIITSVLTISLVITAAFGQDPRPATDDPIRITTKLVQTSVVVLDKQGRFVEGLKPEEILTQG